MPSQYSGRALKLYLLISRSGGQQHAKKLEILPGERTWQELLNPERTLLPSTLVSDSALHLDRFQAVSNLPLYFTWSISRRCGQGVWSSTSHGTGEAAQ